MENIINEFIVILEESIENLSLITNLNYLQLFLIFIMASFVIFVLNITKKI